MSLTKRIWIDRDPAYEHVRQKCAEEAAAARSEFTFRLPTRRRNRLGARPHWDPLWPSSLSKAAKELGIESFNVNDGMLFRTADDRAAVEKLANTLWDDRAAKLQQSRNGSDR